MRIAAALALGVGLFGVAPAARAQLEFEVEEPRIFSIQERPFRLGHEFQIGVGALPLDAFYLGFPIGGSYTYHFTDFWAWEIASIHYTLHVNTSLRGDLDQAYAVQPVRGGGERIRLFAATSVIIKPLFGKLALFNDDIVFSETFFALGFGPFMSVTVNDKIGYWDPALNVGMGLRFWSSQFFSARFDIRDYLIFKNMVGTTDIERQDEGVENTLLFLLSVAFNFADDPGAEVDP